MAKKYQIRLSTSFLMLHTKTTMRSHQICLSEYLKLTRLLTGKSADQDVTQVEYLYIAGGSAKRYSFLEYIVASFYTAK